MPSNKQRHAGKYLSRSVFGHVRKLSTSEPLFATLSESLCSGETDKSPPTGHLFVSHVLVPLTSSASSNRTAECLPAEGSYVYISTESNRIDILCRRFQCARGFLEGRICFLLSRASHARSRIRKGAIAVPSCWQLESEALKRIQPSCLSEYVAIPLVQQG
jgi:hypothetical protein